MNTEKTKFALMIVAVLSACGNSHRYYDQAVIATSSTQDILIEDNFCENRDACSKQGLVFFESGSGVFITIYSISKKSTIDKIYKNICRLHNERIDINHKIKINSTSHAAINENIEFQTSLRSNEKCQ